MLRNFKHKHAAPLWPSKGPALHTQSNSKNRLVKLVPTVIPGKVLIICGRLRVKREEKNTRKKKKSKEIGGKAVPILVEKRVFFPLPI